MLDSMHRLSQQHLGKIYLFAIMGAIIHLFYQATLEIGLLKIIIPFITHLVLLSGIFIVFKTKYALILTKQYKDIIAIFCVLFALKYVCFYLLEMNYSLRSVGSLIIASLFEIALLYLILPIRDKCRRAYIFLVTLFLLLNVVDTVYFYFTFSHIEPMLFDNINWPSIRGSISRLHVGLMAVCLAFFIFSIWLLAQLSDRQSVVSKKEMLQYFIVTLCVSVLCNSIFNKAEGFIYSLNPLDEVLEKTRASYRAKIEKPTWLNLVQISLEYFSYKEGQTTLKSVQNYTYLEADYLKKGGFIKETAQFVSPMKDYQRIIFVVFESLPIDYIHFYNDKIPKEVSPNFDRLLRSYPHVDNFFTSSMPTTQGLNAIINSSVQFDPSFTHKYRSGNLFSLLQNQGYQGYFLRGVSKFYGNERETLPKAFQMQNFIGKEELDAKYKGASGWGYRNDVIYNEGISILKKHQNEKVFLLMKTIDLHQPGVRSGFRVEELPEQVAAQDKLLQAVYWADYQLGLLLKNLDKEGLYDEETLIVITSDHNPHLGLGFKKYASTSNYLRLARIPLIFLSKDNLFSSIHPDIYAGQVDLAPTILSLVGITPPKYFIGKNLLSQEKRRLTFGKHKQSFFFHTPKGTEIIDITKNTDDISSSAIGKWLNNLQTIQYINAEDTAGTVITTK